MIWFIEISVASERFYEMGIDLGAMESWRTKIYWQWM